VSEQDESPVSRRQFFRGMTGGFFRAIGDLSGIDRLLEETETEPEIVNLTEDDVLVPPEKQAKALAEIFGFLEQHEPVAEAEDVVPADEVEAVPEVLDAAPAADPEDPEAGAEPDAGVDHEAPSPEARG
jgi:hypothetical protein